MFLIEDRDEIGRLTSRFSSNGRFDNDKSRIDSCKEVTSSASRLLENVFLPAGYPNSVPPDYFWYQVYNALQAFFSSLAGLIASRAVLEGFGVGNASASATDAMILTIFQDIFSRLTTIIAAYYFGTSLFPEAKTYRFLADLLNDTAIVLDSVSPLLSSEAISLTLPGGFVLGSGLRVAALCLSGSFRALCGIAAGGSKAALTIHFASDGKVAGDVGDLNAKDGSRETVLSLIGMLSGTFILHHLTTPRSTYLTLFLLITGHITANYAAVRAVAMRQLNRRRATIAWHVFRDSQEDCYDGSEDGGFVPTPDEVAARERILTYRPDVLRDERTGEVTGYCEIGSSFASIFNGSYKDRCSTDYFDLDTEFKSVFGPFTNEKFVLWFDHRRCNSGLRLLRMKICLKEGYTSMDKLKAWLYAVEVGREWRRSEKSQPGAYGPDTMIKETSRMMETNGLFPVFIKRMRKAGWNVDEGLLVSGVSRTISVSEEGTEAKERRKDV